MSLRVVVTGGCGYVGSELCRALSSEDGVRVLAVDRCAFGNSLEALPNSEVLCGDIREVDWALLRRWGADAVVHLAGISIDPGYGVSRDLGWQINVGETKRLYEACRTAGVRQFIFPSSCSVYGGGNALHQVDEESCVLPTTDYARAKVAVEEYLRMRQRSSGTEMAVTVLRPATVFGASARQRLDLLVNGFLGCSIFGTVASAPAPNSFRPAVYLPDLIRVYLAVLKRERAKAYEVYNVAFDSRSVEEWAALCGLTGEQVVFRARAGERSYQVSSSRMLEALGVYPTPLLEALRATRGELVRSVCDPLEDRYYNARVQAKVWGGGSASSAAV